MDLDELRRVQATERRTDSLQNLRDSFYQEAADHIAALKQRRDQRAATVDDPFADSEVRRLSDQIETAEEVAESIYERRVGKVVKLASFAASGTDVDTEGLTDPEADLFEDLVDRITTNKESVLDVLQSGASDVDDAPDPEPTATELADAATPPTERDAPREQSAAEQASSGAPDATADGGVLAEAMGHDTEDSQSDSSEMSRSGQDTETTHAPDDGTTDRKRDPGDDADPVGESPAGHAPTDSGDGVPDDGSKDTGTRTPDQEHPEQTTTPGSEPANDGDDRRTVRITEDVGRIYGVDDREYDLKPDDVVRLPTVNAEPLVERDAAEPLE